MNEQESSSGSNRANKERWDVHFKRSDAQDKIEMQGWYCKTDIHHGPWATLATKLQDNRDTTAFKEFVVLGRSRKAMYGVYRVYRYIPVLCVKAHVTI